MKTEYHWSIKHYPDISHLPLDTNEPICKMITRHYRKDGNRWTLDNATEQAISAAYYLNAIEAVPFFRGIGGAERLESSNTSRGHLPIKITSTNKDGSEKTIREFCF